MTNENYVKMVEDANRRFKNFILKSIALILAIFGIACLTGIIKIEKVEETHTAEVFIDGIQVGYQEINPTKGYNVSVDFNIDLNEKGYIGF